MHGACSFSMAASRARRSSTSAFVVILLVSSVALFFMSFIISVLSASARCRSVISSLTWAFLAASSCRSLAMPDKVSASSLLSVIPQKAANSPREILPSLSRSMAAKVCSAACTDHPMSCSLRFNSSLDSTPSPSPSIASNSRSPVPLAFSPDDAGEGKGKGSALPPRLGAPAPSLTLLPLADA